MQVFKKLYKSNKNTFDAEKIGDIPKTCFENSLKIPFHKLKLDPEVLSYLQDDPIFKLTESEIESHTAFEHCVDHPRIKKKYYETIFKFTLTSSVVSLRNWSSLAHRRGGKQV